MNQLPEMKLIYLRELALLAFAVFLLAATPGREISPQATQQPVNMTLPVDQADAVQTNSA